MELIIRKDIIMVYRKITNDPRRKNSSIVISCKFNLQLSALIQGLKLDKEKAEMIKDLPSLKLKEYLLHNHEILDVINCSSEILEFQIVDVGKVIHGQGMIQD